MQLPARRHPLRARPSAPDRFSRRRRRGVGAILLAVLVTIPLVWLATRHSGFPALHAAASEPEATPKVVGTIVDGGQLTTTVGTVSSTLTDSLTPGTDLPTERSYVVHLTASPALPALAADVVTASWVDWSFPSQLPGGADNLPAWPAWTWHVYSGAVNDTANWTFVANGSLERMVPWENANFEIVGTVSLSVPVSVDPKSPDGATPPKIGLVLINPGGGATGPIPAGDSDFTNLLTPLHPSLIRWSQYTAAPATWNNSTGTPSFSFLGFGPMVNLTASVHAKSYVSLPAGTWGDGNYLPAGMPIDPSLVVTFGPDVGYFPTVVAYTTYVRTFVAQTVAHGWSVDYWNIGNEVPVKNNLSVAAAYTQLFNAASAAIHSVDPTSRVGSDVMLANPAFSYFTQNARGVGYLSFHFYVGQGTCMIAGEYCPPNDTVAAPRDATFWAANHTLWGSHFVAPGLAQEEWHNATGNWVAVFDSESNLNKAWQNGTDPRQQTLFGAAWVGSTLIDGAGQNVSTFTYYALESPPLVPSSPSGPYGGWGFGLTSEGTSDNDTLYAPYHALALWSQAFPTGSIGVRASSANSSVVRAFAAVNDSKVSVFLVNRVATAVQIPLTLPGANGANLSVSTLDQGSYLETYSGPLHQTILLKSGTSHSVVAGRTPFPVTLNGYGVAEVSYVPSAPNSSGPNPPSGNSTNSSNPPSGGTNSTSPNSTGGGPGSPPPASGASARPPVPLRQELWGTVVLGGALIVVVAGFRAGRSGAPARSVPHEPLGTRYRA